MMKQESYLIDRATLLEWAMHKERHFSQDDELFLSDRLSPAEILELVDHPEIIPEKRQILFEALCVIIYDQLVDDEQGSLPLAQEVKQGLLNRLPQFREADAAIMTYLKEVVYPFLGIDIHN